MDGVICGHTHRAITEEGGLFGYYNSGCWTENPCTWLSVKGGEVSLRVFQEGFSERFPVQTRGHPDFMPHWEEAPFATAS